MQLGQRQLGARRATPHGHPAHHTLALGAPKQASILGRTAEMVMPRLISARDGASIAAFEDMLRALFT